MSISAAPRLGTFSSFLLTPHFEKASWAYPPKRKIQAWKPWWVKGDTKLSSCVLTFSEQWFTPQVIYQPPWLSGRLSAFDVFQKCFIFSAFQKLLCRISLGLCYYSLVVNLPEHMITSVLVWTHFMSLRQSKNCDNFTYTPSYTSHTNKVPIRYHHYSHADIF